MATKGSEEQKTRMLTVKELMTEGLGGGRDKLIAASSIGDIEHVYYMLERDASPHVKDFDGDTALSAASETGHTSIVEMLIAKGADVNNFSYIGWTPLIFAAANDHLGAAFALLRAGAQVDFPLDKFLGNLRSSPRGSAPGASGTTAEHLQVLLD